MKWFEALHVRGTIVDINPELETVAIWNGSSTINIYAISENGGHWHPATCIGMDDGDFGRPAGTVDDAIECYHRWQAYERDQAQEEE